MENSMPERGSASWEALWKGLAVGLQERGVITTTGPAPRSASVDDFMLMHVDKLGADFKHCGTRNYIRVMHNGFVVIPKTAEPFMRGEF